MKQLEEDRCLCPVCDRVTQWKRMRGGKRLRCAGGCKTTFPCTHKCGHADCEEVKA